MKILVAYPPNYREICTAFPGVKGRQGIIYSWGDVIYNPNNIKIPAELLAHEAVHAQRQQFGGPEAWWNYYCQDNGFRFDEELVAHQAEWSKFLEIHEGHGPRIKAQYLERMIDRFTGPLYRFGLTRNRARDLLTRVAA